jgi:hypothetical protein
LNDPPIIEHAEVFTALKVDGRPLPVLLHERDGDAVFVRELDPGERLSPIRVRPGVDRVVLMTSISATRLCFGPTEGADDALTHPIRVVPDGRDGSAVFMRTLRFGEADDGRRVHLKPGESPVFRAGSLTIELDALDAEFARDADGYQPLSNTIWTWFMIAGREREAVHTRHVMAAARRLDAAAEAWSRVEGLFRALDEIGSESFGPNTRALVFQLLAGVELVVIALWRVVHMVEKTCSQRDVAPPLPAEVARLAPAVKEVRDAFEHIDERAAGEVRQRAHPDALSVFDQSRLLTEGVIAYGNHEISAGEVVGLLGECRQFFKDVTRLA